MPRTRFLLLSSMIVAAAYGCSLDWSVPADAGGGGPKVDGGVDAGTDAIASGPPGFEEGSAPMPDSTGPVTSGCRKNSECLPDSMCVFSSFDCGDTSIGTCVARGTPQDPACPANGKYCGCDGVLYDNACTPLGKGIDLSFTRCKTDQTITAVGYAVCNAGSVTVVDSTQPHHRQYRCEAVPNGCDGGDCNCLGPKFCSATGQNGGTAKCQNGVVTCF